MNILQTITTRKPLKIKDLSPGNGGGGGTPRGMTPHSNAAKYTWVDAPKKKGAPCGCASSG
jgi:hypothetical protein